jgi:sarcosine oxidase subunit gamma
VTDSQLHPTHPLRTRLEAFEELPAGLRITADPFLTMTDLRYLPGGPAEPAVSAVLGVTPPIRPNTWVRGAVGDVIWLGPDEWLVISGLTAPQALEAELRAAVSAHGGAAVDVSAQRLKLVLHGPHVRDILAKGCALDLHPSVFPPGSCAQTTVGRAGVVLLAGEGSNEITLLVRQSFANYLADWLSDAVEEYRTA